MLNFFISVLYCQQLFRFLHNLSSTYLWRFSFFLVHKPYVLYHTIHSLSSPTVFLFACQVLSLIFPWCCTFCRKVPRTTSFPNYNFLKSFTQKFNKVFAEISCHHQLPFIKVTVLLSLRCCKTLGLCVMIFRPREAVSSITCCSLYKFFTIFL